MKKLVGYITSGYPDAAFSSDLALAMGESGVDIIELGVPFSDPVADGAVIERANHLALERGFKFSELLEISEAVAKKVDTLWMGYFNPFYRRGISRVFSEAKELGVKGVIVPDLPHEEAELYRDEFVKYSLDNIVFVAPTDSAERIKTVVKDAQRFIYLVAYAGITGSGKSEDLKSTIESIKEHTNTPIYVGFGVNQKTAKAKVKDVDGVIVGSAFVDVLLQESLTFTQKIDRISTIVRDIKDQINS